MNKAQVLALIASTAFIWLPLLMILVYTIRNWIYNQDWDLHKLKHNLIARLKKTRLNRRAKAGKGCS